MQTFYVLYPTHTRLIITNNLWMARNNDKTAIRWFELLTEIGNTLSIKLFHEKKKQLIFFHILFVFIFLILI